MDGNEFDRIIKAFAGVSVRRQALRASLAGALAAAMAHSGEDADAKKKRRKKKKKKGPPPPACARLTESCASASSCCGNEFGVVACRAQPTGKSNCATQFPGPRCCGLDGVICDPNDGNCGCCDDLVCTLAGPGVFRCASSER
jgi:hypothetical protein